MRRSRTPRARSLDTGDVGYQQKQKDDQEKEERVNQPLRMCEFRPRVDLALQRENQILHAPKSKLHDAPFQHHRGRAVSTLEVLPSRVAPARFQDSYATHPISGTGSRLLLARITDPSFLRLLRCTMLGIVLHHAAMAPSLASSSILCVKTLCAHRMTVDPLTHSTIIPRPRKP